MDQLEEPPPSILSIKMTSYSRGGATTIPAGVTAVDCQKHVRSWRLLRTLMELLIPTCNCTFVEEQEGQHNGQKCSLDCRYYHHHHHHPPLISTATVTGTIFGHRRGKVRLCIQTHLKSAAEPFVLVELAVSTAILAREMRGGVLRIALECPSAVGGGGNSSTLLSTPVWRMYCNGKKVGFAVKRRPSEADMEVLRRMEPVVVGAGIVSAKEFKSDADNLMYLRGKFKRVHGSGLSESFHLIDPEGNIGQELSIYFLGPR